MPWFWDLVEMSSQIPVYLLNQSPVPAVQRQPSQGLIRYLTDGGVPPNRPRSSTCLVTINGYCNRKRGRDVMATWQVQEALVL